MSKDGKTEDVADAKPLVEGSEDTDAFPFRLGGGAARHVQEVRPMPRNVQTQQEFLSDVYKMDHPRRGKAIVINNKQFRSHLQLPDRNGTDQDASALSCRFAELDFDVDLKNDQTVQQMMNLMKQAAAEDHSDADCFACAILTHGENGEIYGVDEKIEVKELLEPFKGNRCETLAGKPKLFFIQACRGTKFDDGADLNVADASGIPDVEMEPPTTIHKIPAEADFLVAYSVVPGYYSWRNSTNGSWFIQALQHHLEQHGRDMDLLRILTRVNRSVAYNFQSNTSHPNMNRKKQIPCVTSMLTKEVYFTPKD